MDFYSVDHTGIQSILSLPGLGVQLSDAIIEPSMELSLLTSAGQLITIPELMRQQSWTDTLQPSSVSFQFAHWFDILASPSAFPFADEAVRSRLARRRAACGGLCVDVLLHDAKGTFPPASWSDLGAMASSTRSPLAFLYLLLASHQSASRVASFCRRHAIDGHQYHLVKASVAADRGSCQQALRHLTLATRSTQNLGESRLVQMIVQILAAESDPVLLATARRLLPAGLIDMHELIDGLVSQDHHSLALSIANADVALFQHLVRTMLIQGKPSALATLPLSPLQVSMATIATDESVPAVQRALAAVMCPLARGWHPAAMEAYGRWAPRIASDHPQWMAVKRIVQMLPASSASTGIASSAPISASPTPIVSLAATPKRAPSTPLPGTVKTVPSTPKPQKSTAVASPPKTGPALLRTPPPQPATGASSPSSAASPSAHGIGSSSPHGSSPPLRSVLPRHVPANQPSRLANLVESSGPESDGGMGSAVGLDPRLFSRPHLLDVIGSEEEEAYSPEESEQSEDLAGMLLDDEIHHVLNDSAQGTPMKKARSPASRSPSKSPKKPFPSRVEPPAIMEELSEKKSSPIKRSPAKKAVTKPTTFPIQTKSTPVKNKTALTETKSTPVKTKSTPVKTKSTPAKTKSTPVKTKATPVKPEAEPTELLASPLKQRGTPSKKSAAQPAESRTQYKRRIKADLGLPSPVAKRPALEEPTTPRRSTRARHPFTDYEPEVERSPQRSRSTLVTPRRPSVAAASTPPIRATPPASSRRSRR